jgi:hypothetical protein
MGGGVFCNIKYSLQQKMSCLNASYEFDSIEVVDHPLKSLKLLRVCNGAPLEVPPSVLYPRAVPLAHAADDVLRVGPDLNVAVRRWTVKKKKKKSMATKLQ